MPAMDDDGFLLADSSAIIQYVEEKHPEPVLIPAGAQERGREIWWEKFVATAFAACSGQQLFNRLVSTQIEVLAGARATAGVGEREQVLHHLESPEREQP